MIQQTTVIGIDDCYYFLKKIRISDLRRSTIKKTQNNVIYMIIRNLIIPTDNAHTRN